MSSSRFESSAEFLSPVGTIGVLLSLYDLACDVVYDVSVDGLECRAVTSGSSLLTIRNLLYDETFIIRPSFQDKRVGEDWYKAARNFVSRLSLICSTSIL